MTNAQPEARAIARKWFSEKDDNGLFLDLSSDIATALAAKDAELAKFDFEKHSLKVSLARAEAQLAEANRKIAEKGKVLEPFAKASGLDGHERDNEPLSGYWADIYNEGPNAITFGHLRAARRAREQGGQNG